jgi:alkylation response protein AidB-like acyl-CoA dehydrogenase
MTTTGEALRGQKVDFSFSDEQVLLRDTIGKYMAAEYDSATRKRIVASPEGHSRETWKQFAELGFLAAPFVEEYGGLGGSAVETMIIMEECGRRLVVEPFIETVVLAGGLLRDLGSEDQRRAFLPRIIDGSDLWALAWAEAQSRHDLHDVALCANRDGNGYRLNGSKQVVVGAPWADHLIVSARTSGGRRDHGGISLFIVDKSQSGVDCRDYATVDGRRAAEIVFDDVVVGPETLIGLEGDGLAGLERAVDHAIAALCAEAVGAMDELNRMTRDYARLRKQFGVPLAKFQVLQHRMVDMFIAYEQALSMTYLTTLALTGDEPERAKAVSGAKVQVGEAARFIGQQAVQIHGGMGMSDELEVGRYFKRLIAINVQFGTPDHHLGRYLQVA